MFFFSERKKKNSPEQIEKGYVKGFHLGYLRHIQKFILTQIKDINFSFLYPR